MLTFTLCQEVCQILWYKNEQGPRTLEACSCSDIGEAGNYNTVVRA